MPTDGSRDAETPLEISLRLASREKMEAAGDIPPEELFQEHAELYDPEEDDGN